MEKKKIMMTVVSSVASVALCLGIGATANAAEPNGLQAITYTQQSEAYELRMNEQAMIQLLNRIMSVPDSVLQAGDKAVQEWMDDHPVIMPRASFWGCAGAIAEVIAGVALPAAKLTKIKKLVKALGGVRKAVQIMAGASFSKEKLLALGGAAAALAVEFTGIDNIQTKCFG